MFYVLLISHRNIYDLIVNKTSMMLFIKSLNTMREVIRIVFEDILFYKSHSNIHRIEIYKKSLPYPDQTTKDHRVNLGLVHLLGA